MNNLDSFEDLFNSATIIKSGKIREVRRQKDIFIKLDKRKNHSFAKEFKCAVKLKKAGIPVTEPLFHLTRPSGNYLATKAFDGITINDFIKNNVPDKDFFTALLELLKKMHHAGFIHFDFHMGNLLYSPDKKVFSLVDVDSIHRIPAFLVPLVPEKIRFHLLTEFRSVLNNSQLLELFSAAKIRNPESFLKKTLIRNAKYIRRNWARRREQILSGYRKFTRINKNGIIFNSSISPEKIETGEKVHDPDAKIFLANFYLDLIQIPHRRAIAFDPTSSTVILEPENNIDANTAPVDDMIERIKFYGIDSEKKDWKSGFSVLPEFHSLEKVSHLPFITKGK